MEKSSLIGKKLLLVKNDFKTAQLDYLVKNNHCEIVEKIEDSFHLNYNEYDHFFCNYNFDMECVKDFFQKLNATEGISNIFLISANELTRIEEAEAIDLQKVEIAQKQIEQYLSKYPDFFAKVEPDFFKKRLINFAIEECGKTPIADLAIFSYDISTIGLISKSEILEDIFCLKLKVNISFGFEKESMIVELNGRCQKVEFDNEDMDNVYCYEYTVTDSNPTYQEIMDALRLQEEALMKKMKVGGYES